MQVTEAWLLLSYEKEAEEDIHPWATFFLSSIFLVSQKEVDNLMQTLTHFSESTGRKLIYAVEDKNGFTSTL